MGNLTDERLEQYSQTVLATSINLFFGLAFELYARESAFLPHLKLAVMDSFRIHARALLFFFYFHNPKPDDAKAQDFMKAGIEWSKVRLDLTPALIDLQRKVGKEVAHLTYSRPYHPNDLVDWDIGTEVRDLLLVLKVFIQNADNSKLHSHVIDAPERWLREFRRWNSLT